MEFKRRMGEVEWVSVTYNFDSAWEKTAASMNPETACGTMIGHTLVFFAANVASERDPPPKGSQWVVMEFSFKNNTIDVKVEVATLLAISVFPARFITDLASALFFLFRINSFFVKKNKRM